MIFKKGVLGKKIDETHKTEHVSKGIVLEMKKKKKKKREKAYGVMSKLLLGIVNQNM